ncbi:MAG: ethylbenzene dehydrogenase-related protein [Deltaproteobacteria bacterium]
MKKVLSVLLLLLAGGALTAYSASSADTKTPKGDLELISKKVSSAPSDASSPEWKQARESKLILVGAGTVEGKILELKAKSVYTKDEVFFRFEWPDADKSMNKNKWKFAGGKWEKQPGDEDRLGVVWEINRIDKFATKGCAVLCHNESKNKKEWYYSVNSSSEKGDLWHWKSVRSNPVGYTEDGFVVANPSMKPEEGRKRDAGSGRAEDNRTQDKSGPAYMQDPAKPASIEGSLLAAEAVEIKNLSMFKAGDEIPGYLLTKEWKGSFADIKTTGIWKDGKWTVTMSRKLVTGNSDDVEFDARKKYSFVAAVFDNANEENSYDSDPLRLEFK